MLGIESIALMFLFIALNLIFLFIKRKTIETTVLHLIIMLFSIVVSIAIILPEQILIGIFVSVFSAVTFLVSVLLTEVK